MSSQNDYFHNSYEPNRFVSDWNRRSWDLWEHVGRSVKTTWTIQIAKISRRFHQNVALSVPGRGDFDNKLSNSLSSPLHLVETEHWLEQVNCKFWFSVSKTAACFETTSWHLQNREHLPPGLKDYHKTSHLVISINTSTAGDWSKKFWRVLLCVSAMIIYISRGLLNSLIEAKRVMSTIASENELLQNNVIINTYAVVDGTCRFLLFVLLCGWNSASQVTCPRCQKKKEMLSWVINWDGKLNFADGKPPIFEKSFMQDIALQNFTKYMVTSQYPTPPPVCISVFVLHFGVLLQQWISWNCNSLQALAVVSVEEHLCLSCFRKGYSWS